MLGLLQSKPLTRSEQIVRDWNRRPRRIKKSIVLGSLLGAATAAAVWAQPGVTVADLTSTVPTQTYAVLAEIRQLHAETVVGLLPLHQGAMVFQRNGPTYTIS